MWTRLVALAWRLRFTLSRRSVDEEIQSELETHFGLLVDRYVRSRMPPRAAHTAARRQLGSTLLVRAEVHQMNRIGWLERLTADLRFASRMHSCAN